MTPSDRLFLARAVELAQRGTGNTAPNPPVGALVVRDNNVLGQGYHQQAGAPHAEVEALRAGVDVRGATMYVSLEPCDHTGRTGPCTQALIEAGIARVVVGALDPNPLTNGRGVQRLRDAGIAVEVADDPAARAVIEIFARSIRGDRPYLALKLAMSFDGYVVSEPGVQQWLTSEDVRAYVRDLRIAYDAVMVGANTARIDDPQLTVRPARHRRRPYLRIVACETQPVPENLHVFAGADGYARTIVLAPDGLRAQFASLENVADVVYVGDGASRLDLIGAMAELRRRGVHSILCEGGPHLGARLIEQRLVDRLYWVIAPVLLSNERAIPVLRGVDLARVQRELRFDGSERVGDDMIISAVFEDV